MSLALLLSSRGEARLPEAIDRLEALRDLAEDAARQHPSHALLAHHRILVNDQLGRARMQAGQESAGVAALERAWELHGRLRHLETGAEVTPLRGLQVASALAFAWIQTGRSEEGRALLFTSILDVDEQVEDRSTSHRLRPLLLRVIRQLEPRLRAAGDERSLARLATVRQRWSSR